MRSTIHTILFLVALAASARAEVLLRWRQGTIPPRDVLGVAAVLLPAGSALAADARDKGYRVTLEAEAGHAADSLSKWPRIRPLFRMRGGQPVQVASRTTQPWIDNNVALIRMQQAAGRRPLLTYAWKPPTGADPQAVPSSEDYAVAIAEAGAFGADLVLDLDEKTLPSWREARRYLDYYAKKRASVPLANVGVLVRDPAPWYEVLNLMARHNVPFRILAPPGPHPAGGLDLVVVTDPLRDPGGLPPERTIRLGDDANDPNAFALKVRNVLGRKRRLVDIWNGITVLAGLEQGTNRMLHLELVNYSAQPLPVQVRVKGIYRRVEYTRPEALAQTIAVEHLDGFTEFVVPDLRIGGTVALRPD